MTIRPDNPLVVQSDHSLLLETTGPHFADARDALLRFAELVKSPEYVHTWRLTPLSLWNAAAVGLTPDDVVGALQRWARYPIPDNVPAQVRSTMGRYGRLRLEPLDDGWMRLVADDDLLMEEVRHLAPVRDLLDEPIDDVSVRVAVGARGELKQVLTHVGHPVQDLAGYTDGDRLDVRLRDTLPDGRAFSLRSYQHEAVDAFAGRGPGSGCGVVVLPCGAGKTLVGIAAMARLGMRTLVLCTGVSALRQWKREILEKTTLTEADVGEYTSERKELAPVTLTTYQILTWRPSNLADPPHYRLFHQANWGLVVYDEVHLLPAPLFRETAYLQARRRLGLTATLVREDHREEDVFSLIGPKRYDVPWKTLEHQGWIAAARCVEVRVPLSDNDRMRHALAEPKQQYRIAATNPRKGLIVEQLLERHADAQILVLGTYLDHLHFIARRWKIPIITGRTKASERTALYEAFRRGEQRVLALSKVGNFAIDLPSASVAIQVSGTFGSRQEEAQRLGRVLRPKPGDNQAVFYTLVTADSREQDFAERRQLFLTEQGYPYRIEHAG